MMCMNDLIVNNIVLIVKQDMICQVISDMVPDMVRSIVREKVTSARKKMIIVREAVTSLREEVQSELQSFYERISTLIERSSAHPAPPPPPPPPLLPPPSKVGKEPPPHSPLPPQAEKEADTATTGPSDDTVHAAVDTSALAADPLTDLVYFF